MGQMAWVLFELELKKLTLDCKTNGHGKNNSVFFHFATCFPNKRNFKQSDLGIQS